MNQPPRQILWVFDRHGNCGKTFLADFLNILYHFQLINGTINTRDLGYMIEEDVKGFAIDVSRAAIANFDYCALEHLKNGYLSTGKYGGKSRRFEVVPIVVFSNAEPDLGQLSMDRWRVLTVGEGILGNMAMDVTISPEEDFPYVDPVAQTPDLTDSYDLRNYLLTSFGEADPVRDGPNQAPSMY